MSDYNPGLAGTVSAPATNRMETVGKQRRPEARSGRTNDPLRLPDGLHPHSQQARRWRDLTGHYAAQLGARIEQEAVRVLLGSLVSMTLVSERLNDRVTRGEHVDPNHIIQLTQSVLRLLGELGLSAASPKPDNDSSLATLLSGEYAP